MSKKIVAVIGITGNQGASVADVFLSEPGWHVRGITRDVHKPTAQVWASKGVELVSADLDDTSSLRKAFEGANVIFGNTDFWGQFMNPLCHEIAKQQDRTPNEVAFDAEVQQGKNLIDAVAANINTLDRFVLSTLSDTAKWSKGKYKYNYHFDAKAEQAKYLKEQYPELAQETSYLQLGIFLSNWKTYGQVPKKQEDGEYIMEFPMSGETQFPIVDPNANTGHFVKALVEVAPGKTLIGAGSLTCWNEWCELWSQHNGVKAKFQRCAREVFEQRLGPIGQEMADMMGYIEDFGYDGGDPNVVYPWDLGVDVKVTTIGDYIQMQDWSSAL